MKQLQSYLGTINFYSKFTEHYAKETYPLYKLLRKDTKFVWTPELNNAFERTKQLFIQERTLAFPDLNRDYYLTVDSSSYAIAGILSQYDDNGIEKIVTIISRTLKGCELAYTVSEWELLSIVFCLRKLYTYLYGAKIIIRCDHKAISFMNKVKYTTSRIMRWLMCISDFDYVVHYIKGSKNVAADAFSRVYDQAYIYERSDEISINAVIKKSTDNKELIYKLKNIQEIQKNDVYIASIIQKLNDGIDEKIMKKYVMENNILMKRMNNKQLNVVINYELLTDLVNELHLLYIHIGTVKILKMILEDFYVKGMRRYIAKILKTCHICQLTKYDQKCKKVPLKIITAERVRQIISVDFYGELPESRGGCGYIFTCIDVFSRFVQLYAIKKANADTILNKIFNHFIPTYGPIEAIISDSGSQFCSKKFNERLMKNNIKLYHSPYYTPSNNLIERQHKEMGKFFRVLCHDSHKSWACHVDLIQNIINQTYHSTIEFTPMELFLNKKPTRIWQNYIKSNINNDKNIPYEEKLYLAKENVKKNRKRANDLLNKYTVKIKYNIGDLVSVRARNKSDVLQGKISKFFDIFYGPFKIKRSLGDYSYILEDLNNIEKTGKYNYKDCRKYYPKER